MIGEWENWLLEQVAEAGRLGRSRVRADERFTSYGLDSLAITAILTRAGQRVGRAVPATAAWRYPTVGELARYLAGPARSEAVDRARSTAPRPQREPIAVIGLAARLPGAATVDEFWELLCTGRDAVGATPVQRWDAMRWFHPDRDEPGKVATRHGGFLDEIAEFDPLFFGISPGEAAQIDPQQRLTLELAWEALDDAGVRPGGLRGQAVGVYTGAMWTDYAALLAADPALMTSYSATGMDTSIISARISYLLGLTGPSITVNTACSSSLVAIHQAIRALSSGDCDMAVAGGVSLMLTPPSTVAMSRFGAMSPDGRCKAFDSRANGYVRGEGAGLVVLAPLSRALAEGHRIYCTILGGAVNNDGFSNGLTAPNPAAQEAVLRAACADAGIAPGDVDFVETHGTGTELGDPIEASALGAVYGADRGGPLLLGAVKTNIGHLEAAAGVAGFIKTALALYHRTIPPNLHFERPNPHIDFETWRLAVPTSARAWPRRESGAAYAGVSGFGFGGTNCHVVLGEWKSDNSPLLVPHGAADPPVVLVFGGQGSQWPAMAAELMARPAFAVAVRRCDAAFAPYLGGSIAHALCRPAPLPDTTWVQAGVFTMQVALTNLWMSAGLQPAAVIGQSMGEIAAAHVSGALSVEDAALIVCTRTRLVGELAGPGAMAVVESGEPEVRSTITEAGASVAVVPAPDRCVISGTPDVVAACTAALAAAGISVRGIDVDYASHAPAMDPVLPRLRSELSRITPGPAGIPMWSTVTGDQLDASVLTADYWCRNLREPVSFADTVTAVARALGNPVLLDVNPHPITVRDVQACVPELSVLASLQRDRPAAAVLAATAAALREAGGGPSVVVGAQPEPPLTATSLLTVSARDPRALPESARRLASRLRDADAETFADICHTALRHRDHHDYRLAVVADDGAQATEALDAFAEGTPTPRLWQRRAAHPRPKIVFVFPGQGGQYASMGVRLYAHEPAFRRAAYTCAELLLAEGGPDLGPWLRGERPLDTEAMDTVQPALFTVSVALSALLRDWGVVPDDVIGHSMGEVAAAYVCGALTLPDAVRVICRRSAALADLSGAGSMMLVDLDEAQAAAAATDGVEIAAVNGPHTCVLAGPPEPMAALAARLEVQGVLVRSLQVNAAAHSRQVEPSLPGVRSGLRGLLPRAGHIPFLSTVTGRAHTGEDLDADYWVRNLRATVRFSAVVAAEIDRGPVCFVELGPHPVLTGAIEETATRDPRDRDVTAVGVLHRDRPDRESLLSALAALYTAGADLDLTRMPIPYGRQIGLPAYPWQRRRYWLTEDPGAGESDTDTTDLRSELDAADTNRGIALVYGYLADQLCSLLRARPGELRVDAPITTSGATSLTAMQLRNAVLRDLGAEVPVSAILEASCLSELTELVLHAFRDGASAEPTNPYTEITL